MRVRLPKGHLPVATLTLVHTLYINDIRLYKLIKTVKLLLKRRNEDEKF